MTKGKEKQILTEFVEQLGTDSYTGQWLREQLPFLFSVIDNDLHPSVGAMTMREMTEMTEYCAKKRIECDNEIKLKKEAYDKAIKKELEDCNATCRKIKDRCYSELKRAMRELGYDG